jgi:hypothetical protein
MRHRTDASKYLQATVSGVSVQSGYVNITLSVSGFSESSPFSDEDPVSLIVFNVEPIQRPRAIALLKSGLSSLSLVGYSNTVTSWDNGENIEKTTLLAMSSEDMTNTFLVGASADQDDQFIYRVYDSMDLSGPILTVDTFHQLAFNLDDESVFAMFVDAVFIVNGTTTTLTTPFEQRELNQLTLASAAIGGLNPGHNYAPFNPVVPLNAGKQIISLLQLYSTARTTAYLAYQNSMIDNGTFWDGWTLG